MCGGTVGSYRTLSDRNYCYRDYPSIIMAAGLNGLGAATKPDVDYKALYEAEKAKYNNLVAYLKALVAKL